ncbi:DUF2277 domain-containing protein [Lysobacter sp. 5GHs7-4]|uniref:DUF2277 domain-containing protein n=1 Tax=Lysobacter sp. 5GHs7-4 TaxID=2904253 RepID=UPI001E4E83FB|nr:DUF2277 domain-containing protein [Lysobacter sp. 5GHs7-4]UHQ22262.1 DUF2277 domain-containing protein [Lysobacter sp. 5GHs7-4]
MCRNIRTLYNFEPPATADEVRASALQFVRKLSGFNAPSQANQAAFDLAVKQVSEAATTLINSLTTFSPPKNRDVERAKAAELSAKRFGRPAGSGQSSKPKAQRG